MSVEIEQISVKAKNRVAGEVSVIERMACELGLKPWRVVYACRTHPRAQSNENRPRNDVDGGNSTKVVAKITVFVSRLPCEL